MPWYRMYSDDDQTEPMDLWWNNNCGAFEILNGDPAPRVVKLDWPVDLYDSRVEDQQLIALLDEAFKEKEFGPVFDYMTEQCLICNDPGGAK